jgi:hypothetical protein
MTDFRALCAELTDSLEEWLSSNSIGGISLDDGTDAELIYRARAALAQPAPPVDGEVAELVAWLRDRANSTSLAYNARRITRVADLLEKSMTKDKKIIKIAGRDASLNVAARVESGTPIGYRLARYRTAEGAVHLKLQGAYQWTEGANGGLEWRDIETVDLDQEAVND